MKSLAALIAGILFATAAGAAEQPDAAVRSAIDKGLRRLEQGAASYPKHRQCFSCHHQAMAVMTMAAAQQRGFPVDAGLLQQQIDFSLKTFRNRSLIAQGRRVGGDSTGVVYVLHMLAAAERPYDETTAALVRYLLVKQRPDGAWPIPAFGNRPPTMGSLFTNTGLAMAVLKHYRPPEDAAQAAELLPRVDAALAKGRAWLLANTPSSTEDKVFHLRGLVWANVEAAAIDQARDRLRGEQRDDGSWAQLKDMAGDAYATATVLVALRHASLDAGHASYQKGIKYLLAGQKEDGAWIVETRSRPLQRFFDNGDPGGKSQFISFAATGWAVLALLETVPAAE